MDVLIFVILLQEITKIVYHVKFYMLYIDVLNVQDILYLLL